MEILKIREWLENKSKRQFEIVLDKNGMCFRRIKTSCIFRCGEIISTIHGLALITSFEPDFIHITVKLANWVSNKIILEINSVNKIKNEFISPDVSI